MPKNGETCERLGIVYRISIYGKIYIGKTIQPLDKRIRSHVRDAINGRSNKSFISDTPLPPLKPTQNFTGKSSVIHTVMTRHNDWKWLKDEPQKRKKVQWLFEKIMKMTEILHEVKCTSTYSIPKGKNKGRWETNTFELSNLESKAIKKVWIEDPKSLLNLAGRPLNQHFEQRLMLSLYQDLERIRGDALCFEDEQIKMIINNRRSNYRKELKVINELLRSFEQWTPFERAEYLHEHELDNAISDF